MCCDDCWEDECCGTWSRRRHLDNIDNEAFLDELVRRTPGLLMMAVLWAVQSVTLFAMSIPTLCRQAILTCVRNHQKQRERTSRAQQRLLIRQDSALLMKLPAEIRIRIYELVFHGLKVNLCPDRVIEDARTATTEDVKRRVSRLSLLHTCRQLRYEGLTIVGDLVTFILEQGPLYIPNPAVFDTIDIWKQLRETWRHLPVKRLSLEHITPFDHPWEIILPWISHTFPNITVLDISESSPYESGWCCLLLGPNAIGGSGSDDDDAHWEVRGHLDQWKQWYAQAHWLLPKTCIDTTVHVELGSTYECRRHWKGGYMAIEFNFEKRTAYYQEVQKKWACEDEKVLEALFGKGAEKEEEAAEDDANANANDATHTPRRRGNVLQRFAKAFDTTFDGQDYRWKLRGGIRD